MQYDQRVLHPRSAPKPTLNQNTLLSLVVLVFVFVNRASVHICIYIYIYIYIDKRSHDEKSARVISKTLRSRALKLERFLCENIPVLHLTRSYVADKAHYVITVW